MCNKILWKYTFFKKNWSYFQDLEKGFFSTSLQEIVRGETRISFLYIFFFSLSWKTLVCKNTYLSVKKAFSVRPEQAVATAITKVVIPKVEWIGTKAARKEAVADSQHNKSRKLKNPTTNCNRKSKLIFHIFFFWLPLFGVEVQKRKYNVFFFHYSQVSGEKIRITQPWNNRKSR